MRVTCPHCHERVDLTSTSDDSIHCPSCNRSFVIPVEETVDFREAADLVERAPPRRLGRYRLLSELGRGATSVVFLAYDIELNRKVALKMSRSSNLDDQQFQTMKIEASTAAQLKHPNIAAVFDFGVQDGQVYLVQEYVEGEALGAWRERVQPRPAQSAEVCAEIAEALTHAHELGIIHRDIKPSNVVIDASGRPHVIDFGVAIDLSSAGDKEDWEPLIGTPAYLSPEQARGESSIDPRSDIYSLGVMLYELLTGQRPFQSSEETFQGLLREIVDGRPRGPREVNSRVPPAIDRICRKCLERDLARRYRTAGELANDLRRFNDGLPTASRSKGLPFLGRPRQWLSGMFASPPATALAEVEAERDRLREENEVLQKQLADRARMLIAAKAEHDIYRSLVESLPLCVYRKDLNGEFVYTNEFFNDTFGQAEGKCAADLFPGVIAAAQEDDDAAVQASGDVSRTEEQHLGADGTPVFFEVLKSPVHNMRGAVVGVQGLMWDVSDHAKLEQALTDAKEAAEEAMNAAEEANRSKSDFLANMSHELRTPLSGVLGYLGILRRDDVVVGLQKGNLDAIENCANHLLGVINDVLDLSKIESGQVDVDRSPTHLHRLLRGVGDIVRVRAESKGLQLNIDYPLDLPNLVMTDENKLRQILVNLAANAVKFTDSGSVSIGVACLDNDMVRIEVADTGRGIEESKIAEIMEPFVQLQKGAEGAGLGLAIAKRYVEEMNGTLEVQSSYGEGSAFTVTLPMPAVETSYDDSATFVADEEVNFRLEEGQCFSILVADDVKENRDVLQQHLTLAGFDVSLAGNGEEAIELMRAGHFDLALMDIRMPTMDGLEAIAMIRNETRLRESKVIAVTASVFREDEAKIVEAGFDDFLGKPIAMAHLFTKLAQHVGARYVRGVQNAVASNEHAAAQSNWSREVADELASASAQGDIGRLRKIGEGLLMHETLRPVGERILKHVAAFQLPAIREMISDLNSQLSDEEDEH